MDSLEHEVKLGAWPGLELPDLTDVVPGATVVALPPLRLDATYYDTSDLRLTRAGASLRCRTGQGDDEPWTVKLPGGPSALGLVRREISFAGAERRIPAAAHSLVRGLARSAPLAAVARLRTDRRRLRVCGPGGEALAEVDDDEVSVLVGRRVASRFREIEVELTAGADPSVLNAVVAVLRRAGATESDPTPKVIRALGPAAVAPPDAVAPGRRTPKTIGEAVTAVIAGSVSGLVAHDPGVRLGNDPEDVHKARVATRRLRSDLRTLRSLLDDGWVQELREELRWIAGLLGAVRDTDVLIERLESHVARLNPDDRPGGDRLVERLRRQRDAARVELLAGLDTPRYTDLLERLVVAAREPFVGPDVDPDHGAEGMAELVLRPWRHLAAAVNSLESDAPDGKPSDDALHEVRIRAKRCRYAAEAVGAIVGKPAVAFAAGVADLQTVLGDFHDAVVAEAWLREVCASESAVPTSASREEAFVAGQLVTIERQAAQALRAEWPQAWKRASAGKRRRWIPGA